jgi:hypothetical protein
LICDGVQQAAELGPVGAHVVPGPQQELPPQGVVPVEQHSPWLELRHVSVAKQQPPMGGVTCPSPPQATGQHALGWLSQLTWHLY